MLAPGSDKKELKASPEDDTLIIRCELAVEQAEGEERRRMRREFAMQLFERSLVPPQPKNGHAMKPDYTNSVLKLAIPEKEGSEPRVRAISVA